MALLGLTSKPNTDDMRNAPSLAIAQSLLDYGVHVRAFDPEGMAAARGMMPGLTCCTDAYEAAAGADAVVIVTERDGFRALDLRQLGAVMTGRALIDLRNIYCRDAVEAAGFTYTAVGR
jgi:UDPglucose 6-dehydrogenase